MSKKNIPKGKNAKDKTPAKKDEEKHTEDVKEPQSPVKNSLDDLLNNDTTLDNSKDKKDKLRHKFDRLSKEDKKKMLEVPGVQEIVVRVQKYSKMPTYYVEDIETIDSFILNLWKQIEILQENFGYESRIIKRNKYAIKPDLTTKTRENNLKEIFEFYTKKIDQTAQSYTFNRKGYENHVLSKQKFMNFARDFGLNKISQRLKKNLIPIFDRYLYNVWKNPNDPKNKIRSDLLEDLKSDPFQFLDLKGFKECIEKAGLDALDQMDENFPTREDKINAIYEFLGIDIPDFYRPLMEKKNPAFDIQEKEYFRLKKPGSMPSLAEKEKKEKYMAIYEKEFNTVLNDCQEQRKENWQECYHSIKLNPGKSLSASLMHLKKEKIAQEEDNQQQYLYDQIKNRHKTQNIKNRHDLENWKNLQQLTSNQMKDIALGKKENDKTKVDFFDMFQNQFQNPFKNMNSSALYAGQLTRKRAIEIDAEQKKKQQQLMNYLNKNKSRGQISQHDYNYQSQLIMSPSGGYKKTINYESPGKSASPSKFRQQKQYA